MPCSKASGAEAYPMTRNAGFKKVVRRHAAATGQRYTEALEYSPKVNPRSGPSGVIARPFHSSTPRTIRSPPVRVRSALNSR